MKLSKSAELRDFEGKELLDQQAFQKFWRVRLFTVIVQWNRREVLSHLHSMTTFQINFIGFLKVENTIVTNFSSWQILKGFVDQTIEGLIKGMIHHWFWKEFIHSNQSSSFQNRHRKTNRVKILDGNISLRDWYKYHLCKHPTFRLKLTQIVLIITKAISYL